VLEWKRQLRRGLTRVSWQVDRLGRALLYVALGTMKLDDLRAGIEQRFGAFFVDDADTASGLMSFSWFCYKYIPESRRRVEALRKAARHLAPGGRILVSCHSLGEVPSSRLMNVQRMIARWCSSDWQLEKGDVVTPFSMDRGRL
jgi:hypothetical protein